MKKLLEKLHIRPLRGLTWKNLNTKIIVIYIPLKIHCIFSIYFINLWK